LPFISIFLKTYNFFQNSKGILKSQEFCFQKKAIKLSKLLENDI